VADLHAQLVSAQAVVSAAQAVLDGTLSTRAQVGAARATLTLYDAIIADLQAQLAPQAARTWTVRAGDTLPWLALRVYGDSTRTGFGRIQRANGLIGLALQPGQVLTIPT
jgi:nucleoid-associated protein YgaU